MILSASPLLSVDSQLMWFNCNSVFSVSSIPGGLNLFLQLFVLDIFAFAVLVFYFYICFENRGNGYYSYEVIRKNFFVDCYCLNFCFASYLVIYYDSNCYWFVDNWICCMNCFLIFCFGNVGFGYLNNLYSYCLNSFCFYCMVNFVIYRLNSV